MSALYDFQPAADGRHDRESGDRDTSSRDAHADASRGAARAGYKICRQGHVFRGFDITCPYCSLLKARGERGPKLR